MREKLRKQKEVFPSEDSLLKSLFLGIRQDLEKKWTDKVHNLM
jgi:hypothetical protein